MILDWRLYAAAAGAVLLAFGVGSWLGHRDGVSDERGRAAVAVAEAKARNAGAIAKSDVSRAADQAETKALQKELADADDAAPDSRPSAARLALACKRLRLQNPRAAVPIECRPYAGS